MGRYTEAEWEKMVDEYIRDYGDEAMDREDICECDRCGDPELFELMSRKSSGLNYCIQCAED